VDIGPTTPETTHAPAHGEAAACRVASGDCALGIVLFGAGQGIMLAAHKVRGSRCGVCSDTLPAKMIRVHNDATFEGGHHATRVAIIDALES
jgi:ribose 5-phosphate isomerase B